MNTIKIVGVTTNKQYGEEINLENYSSTPKSNFRPYEELYDEVIERVEEAHLFGNEDARIIKSSGEEITIVNKGEEFAIVNERLAIEFLNDIILN